MKTLAALQKKIRRCTICAEHLPQEPRPVVSCAREAKILIIGQAPGRKVHESGIPWDDPSGKRLREWMGVDDKTFYDSSQIALMPMAFCYPGTGKSGDLPPRPECAEAWHARLLSMMPKVELTLLLSQYSQNAYLEEWLSTVTETVKNWRVYLPEYLPMPHPSPRNNIWLKKNPWFEKEVIPYLQDSVGKLLR